MDPLAAYALTDFEGHRVYVRGTGSAVLVFHEMPGLHPGVAAFADRLVDHGFAVYLPSFFGKDGAVVGKGPPVLRMGRALFEICVRREFALLRDRTSPAVSWLRRLAAHAHSQRGGPGVGVVGMCITGGFALAMAIEDTVVAPVLSQPSLPWVLPFRERTLGIDRDELAQVQARAAEGLDVLGLRFSGDRLCPRGRFERLGEELGPHFQSVEIDSSACNAADIRERAHSVLTGDLVDRPGHPTREALDRVMTFLEERLKAAPPQPDRRD